MHHRDTVDLAIRLSSCGLLDSENALILGVSIHTLRHWRQGRRRATRDRTRKRSCPWCHSENLDAAAYAHLLGLYLGDGHITRGTKGTYTLWLFCGNTWPGLIDEAERSTRLVMPASVAFRTARGHGCRVTNRVVRRFAAREKEYEYPRYFFSNESTDILRLCGDALDRLGIAWRYSRPNVISVARKEAVAALDEFVGPKY